MAKPGSDQKPADGKPKQRGIRKGKPEVMPVAAMRAGATADRCRDCVITAVNGQAFPAGTTTATSFVADNTAAYVINATPNPATCPCTWSKEVFVEYVGVLTGAAKTLKRKNMQFPQILERIRIDPRQAQNPYFTIAGCTLTIKVSALDQDLRAGINTQHAFFRGVVTQLKLGVKCNGTYRTIIINITDP